MIGSDTADVTGLPATLYPDFGVTGINVPNGADYSIDFDNVRIILEPASAALTFGVLGSLLLARRRRSVTRQMASAD